MSRSNIAVAVRGLSKSYSIAHEQERHVTLAEAMLARLKNPFKRAERETFWALKDVSFDIKKGDVVGIIGRNGAGKSTLLKILSRITEPTKGEVEIHGRIGSLLEVGTGFHPELTGRENIFLNGQILGMRKSEIRKQFDAIVDFSGCEQFLDTPVKRYSSGMYVRLAFAVAAHLSTEILVVDEVLAVGDAEFQKKCLGKMKDVANEGRTVLFVSHNMAAVKLLCDRCVLLVQGRIHADAGSENIVREYLSHLSYKGTNVQIDRRDDRGGSGTVRIVRIEGMVGDTILSNLTLPVGTPIRFRFHLNKSVRDVQLIFALYDANGQIAVDFNSQTESHSDTRSREPVQDIDCSLPELNLTPGEYRMNVAAFHEGKMADHVEGAALIVVAAGTLGDRPIVVGTRGIAVLRHVWHFGDAAA